MQRPEISIIIPTYNEKNSILKTLEQFRYIDGNFEIIIADGDSSDGTKEIVSKFARESKFPVHCLVSEKKGRGQQMNAGSREARADILLFLHADTILPEGALKDIKSALQNPQIVAGAFPIRFTNDAFRFRILETYSNNRARFTKMFHGDQSIFIRREIFDKMGGYKNFPIMEDVDFSLRIKKYGQRAFLKKQVLTSARRIEANGFFYSIYIYLKMKFLFYIGVSPAKLAKIYNGMKKE